MLQKHTTALQEHCSVISVLSLYSLGSFVLHLSSIKRAAQDVSHPGNFWGLTAAFCHLREPAALGCGPYACLPQTRKPARRGHHAAADLRVAPSQVTQHLVLTSPYTGTCWYWVLSHPGISASGSNIHLQGLARYSILLMPVRVALGLQSREGNLFQPNKKEKYGK